VHRVTCRTWGRRQCCRRVSAFVVVADRDDRHGHHHTPLMLIVDHLCVFVCVCVTSFCLIHKLLFYFKLILTRVIRDGWTALYYSAFTNQSECMQALVRTKADVNIRNKCAYLTFYCDCKRRSQVCLQRGRISFRKGCEKRFHGVHFAA
jgi:hypothetical protein